MEEALRLLVREEDQNSHWSVKKKYRKCLATWYNFYNNNSLEQSSVHKPQEELISVESECLSASY